MAGITRLHKKQRRQKAPFHVLVELSGIEPLTSTLPVLTEKNFSL